MNARHAQARDACGSLAPSTLLRPHTSVRRFRSAAKRLAVVLSLFGVASIRCLAPAPVYAEDWPILMGIAIGAYAGVVIVGTEIYRTGKGPFGFAPGEPDSARRPPSNGVRLGPQCPQTLRGITVVCW